MCEGNLRYLLEKGFSSFWLIIPRGLGKVWFQKYLDLRNKKSEKNKHLHNEEFHEQYPWIIITIIK
jgi:hypothetical protein